MRLLKRPLRILAVMGKEVVEILRRPRSLLGVLAGPVVILAVFGLGYVGQPPLRTELVVPPGQGLPGDPASYASVAGSQVSIVGVTGDIDVARAELRGHAIDLLVAVPPDAESQLAAGQQAVMTVEYDSVSPYRAFIARTAADAIVSDVNRRIIEAAVKQAEDKAGAAGQASSAVKPEVIAAPIRADVADLAPSPPALVAFYGIMVLALIVQHTVLTVSSLSLLHDRRHGMLDLFRISPAGGGDILAGKYAAFALLGSVMALAVLAVLVFGFGVPVLGAPVPIVGCLALLVVASVGLGTVIALTAATERQAIQISMLVLLGSVFFSGLALDLDQFSAPVRAVSQVLPVTQAGTLLQDLLLQGSTTDPWRFTALVVMAGGLFGVGWLILRRQLGRPG